MALCDLPVNVWKPLVGQTNKNLYQEEKRQQTCEKIDSSFLGHLLYESPWLVYKVLVRSEWDNSSISENSCDLDEFQHLVPEPDTFCWFWNRSPSEEKQPEFVQVCLAYSADERQTKRQWKAHSEHRNKSKFCYDRRIIRHRAIYFFCLLVIFFFAFSHDKDINLAERVLSFFWLFS